MSRSMKIWRFVRKYPLAVLGVLICAAFLVVAALAPLIAAQNPLAQDLAARYAAPGAGHLFGTDNFGRDIFSRVVHGARISMPAGFLVVIASCLFGGLYGAVAGYFGKWLDEVMMRIADIVMSFPSLVLAIALGAMFGKTMLNTILILAVVEWPRYARMMRGLVLSVRETEYVTSAVTLGERKMSILLRTIIPNCVAPLLVMASASLGTAILLFSGLGFLGMGVAPPTPEWGAMVSEGAAMLKAWWVSFFPGIAIFAVSMAFNFIGDALRDILDPRLRNLN